VTASFARAAVVMRDSETPLFPLTPPASDALNRAIADIAMRIRPLRIGERQRLLCADQAHRSAGPSLLQKAPQDAHSNVTNCGRLMSRVLERNRSSRWRCPFFPDAPCWHSVHISTFKWLDPLSFDIDNAVLLAAHDLFHLLQHTPEGLSSGERPRANGRGHQLHNYPPLVKGRSSNEGVYANSPFSRESATGSSILQVRSDGFRIPKLTLAKRPPAKPSKGGISAGITLAV
jgi:hypothetical protein